MKLVLCLVIPLILFIGAPSVMADAPDLKKGVYIYDGNNPLNVDRHSNPFCVDWNNDGAKDLLVGQFTYGYIWLYLNQGTDLNPVFDGGSLVQSNGVPIQVTYG